MAVESSSFTTLFLKFLPAFQFVNSDFSLFLVDGVFSSVVRSVMFKFELQIIPDIYGEKP
jgi:hypothetical protein